MSDTAAGLLTVLALVVVLGVTHVPLGDYMARVYSATRHWRAERLLYRLCRIDPDADQSWPTYALSVLGFSLASVLFLFGLQRVQNLLPLSLGFDPVQPQLAWNTAASFVTNTNWQNYSGEVDHGPPGPDGRSRRAELRLGGCRHGRGRGAGARLRPVPDQPGGQLLGRPDPRVPPHPAAPEHRRRRCC